MNDPRNNTIILVNSFRESGIGSFGWKLKLELEKKMPVKYVEITPTWRGLFRLWNDILLCNSKVVFNLGFTSFGRSIYRNFINFLILKIFSLLLPGQSLILHDSIDTSNIENSGYSKSWLMPLGGSIATKMLKDFKIFVFSKRFYDILNKKYGFSHVFYFPFPTERETTLECYREDMEPLLLNVGYIAPYKGLDILPEIKTKLNNINTMIVGTFYKNLLLTKDGPLYKEELVKVMENAGIIMSGYVDDDSLIKLVRTHRTIAILPYLSGYNASYSAIMFVALGIPVVATNIDIFLESRENGAGIILVDRTTDAFVRAINRILESPDLSQALVEKDKKYCTQYSITNFCNFMVNASNLNSSDLGTCN